PSTTAPPPKSGAKIGFTFALDAQDVESTDPLNARQMQAFLGYQTLTVASPSCDACSRTSAEPFCDDRTWGTPALQYHRRMRRLALALFVIVAACAKKPSSNESSGDAPPPLTLTSTPSAATSSTSTSASSASASSAAAQGPITDLVVGTGAE